MISAVWNGQKHAPNRWLASRLLDQSLLENSSLAAWVIRAVGRGRTMKRSKFTEAQIAFILRQGEEGTAVGEICRKAGISEATYYSWRKKYGGLTPTEMKRLRQLEEENGKLKKIVADLSLEKEMLQDVIRRKLWSLYGSGNWWVKHRRLGKECF